MINVTICAWALICSSSTIKLLLAEEISWEFEKGGDLGGKTEQTKHLPNVQGTFSHPNILSGVQPKALDGS